MKIIMREPQNQDPPEIRMLIFEMTNLDLK